MAERMGRVGRGGSDAVPDGDEDADFDWRRGRGPGRGLAALLVLAVGGLLVYLAWSIIWDRSHPASPAALRVRDGDAAARLTALRDLERLGPEDPDIALPALARGLSDPEMENRAAAIDGLLTVIQYVGPSGSSPEGVAAAVAGLIGLLDDPHPVIRARVSQALWTAVLIWQGSPQALELDRIAAAMGQMAGDPDPRIRSSAVRGLGVVGRRLSDDPPSPLLAALDDPSDNIRTAAAVAIRSFHRGLARLIPKLVGGIEATRPECRPAYFLVLGEIRPGLNDGPPDEELIPALASALESRDRGARCRFAEILGQFREQARPAIPALLALLREPAEAGPPVCADAPGLSEVAGRSGGEEPPADPAIVAIEALEEIGQARSSYPGGREVIIPAAEEVAAALGALLESPDPRRRAEVIGALRRFPPEATLIPALDAAVSDRDPSVRAAALLTLRDYALTRAFPPPKALPRAMEDDDPEVRLAAADLIGPLRSGAEPMVPALIRHARQDPVGVVRSHCEAALGRLRPPAITAAVVPMYVEAIDSPGSSSGLRKELIAAVAGFGPEAAAALPVLRKLIGSRNPEIREAARTAAAAIEGDGR